MMAIITLLLIFQIVKFPRSNDALRLAGLVEFILPADRVRVWVDLTSA
jgi:hypothetical protein